MTHKNWDNVRDHRIIGYFNQKELDTFLQAMLEKDISQKGTALREFALAQAEQIIVNSRKQNNKQNTTIFPTVKYQFLNAENTVNSTVKH